MVTKITVDNGIYTNVIFMGMRGETFDETELGTSTAFVDGLKECMYQIERSILQHALVLNHGNRRLAAKQIGLKRTTFVEKCKRHGLIQPQNRGKKGSAPEGDKE